MQRPNKVLRFTPSGASPGALYARRRHAFSRSCGIRREVDVSPFTRARIRKGIHGERVPTHGASSHRLIPSSCVLPGLSTRAAPPGRMTARRQHLSGPPGVRLSTVEFGQGPYRPVMERLNRS